MSLSLSKIYVHIVFSTKFRDDSILKNDQKELFSYIGNICRELGCSPIAVGGTMNHVHILCTLSRTITISGLVNKVKSCSAKWYNAKCPYRFAWQSGYGVFSVSQSMVNKVVDYILGQEEHHKKVPYEDEYLAFLRKHNIEFDKDFVWKEL